jgi:hypothetical protein
MTIVTNIGNFNEREFVIKCNNRPLPEGISVKGTLLLFDTVYSRDLPSFFSKSPHKKSYLKFLPEGLKVSEHLNLYDCSALTNLPDSLKVGGSLHLRRCTSLTVLPVGLEVGGTLYVDYEFVENYPLREIPKILYLPFEPERKQVLLNRLSSLQKDLKKHS